MKKNNIILIGFMASGKSVVAKKLAKKLKMSMTDTDMLIENEEGIKIKEIFKIHGEAYFRKLEKEIVRKISCLRGVIISTGGGVVLNAENRRILRKSGIVFYLKVNPEAVLKRIKRAVNNERPLLANKSNLKYEIKKLLKQRMPYYNSCTHYVVDTSKMTSGQVIDKITRILVKGKRC